MEGDRENLRQVGSDGRSIPNDQSFASSSRPTPMTGLTNGRSEDVSNLWENPPPTRSTNLRENAVAPGPQTSRLSAPTHLGKTIHTSRIVKNLAPSRSNAGPSRANAAAEALARREQNEQERKEKKTQAGSLLRGASLSPSPPATPKRSSRLREVMSMDDEESSDSGYESDVGGSASPKTGGGKDDGSQDTSKFRMSSINDSLNNVDATVAPRRPDMNPVQKHFPPPNDAKPLKSAMKKPEDTSNLSMKSMVDSLDDIDTSAGAPAQPTSTATSTNSVIQQPSFSAPLPPTAGQVFPAFVSQTAQPQAPMPPMPGSGLSAPPMQQPAQDTALNDIGAGPSSAACLQPLICQRSSPRLSR